MTGDVEQQYRIGRDDESSLLGGDPVMVLFEVVKSGPEARKE